MRIVREVQLIQGTHTEREKAENFWFGAFGVCVWRFSFFFSVSLFSLPESLVSFVGVHVVNVHSEESTCAFANVYVHIERKAKRKR